MMNLFRSLSIGLATFAFAAVCPAQAQNAPAIMQKVSAVMGHFESGVAEVNLVTGEGNKTRQRLLRLVSKQEDGIRQLIATFAHRQR